MVSNMVNGTTGHALDLTVLVSEQWDVDGDPRFADALSAADSHGGVDECYDFDTGLGNYLIKAQFTEFNLTKFLSPLARPVVYFHTSISHAAPPVRHGEQCLLYLVLGNAGIQPALTEWISMLQLAGGPPSQPLRGFRLRAHRSSGPDVDLAAVSIKI
ncbi:hypothetical protein PENARI_c008G03810 [Penicillium arizonense]|uniref:Uncharacterized protein n=1 Tax=Penicillium arizonense TaxID=1835702 RepID=A0A1F5LIT2_PENAI|nr:hypothetical protein PENARI_c008G03810 [Penicillium arizonense]OGE53122.1 hypothetical protein PENARI_c008G03810 [Penicillium arizonense]